LKDVHIVIGVLSLVLNAAAGGWGAWRYWRAEPSTLFWRLLRCGQVAVVAEAALGGVLELTGKKAPGIHIIYGLLPLLISFVAEQLRIASAQMVLDARGYESASAVGGLPDDEQQSIVRAILLREMGVMTLSALVVVVLLARAAGTA
jgi:hypothetical protein